MQKTPVSSIPFKTETGKARTSRLLFFALDADLGSARFRINVLFTNANDTRAALKMAAQMAADLNAEIALIAPRVVPFPLPLDQPPIALEFAVREICRLAESIEMDLRGFLYLCRNPLETLHHVLRPRSLVIIGARAHWPFGKSRRLAMALRRHGCEVFVANHG